MSRTLWLGPRYTQDSIRLRRLALERGWAVERVQGWSASEARGASGVGAVVYAQTLVAQAIASGLGLELLDAPTDWLETCPEWSLGRSVRAMTVGEARELEGRWFVKPASEKWFRAGVYEGDEVREQTEGLPEDDPVLVSEVVAFDSEFRCFVAEGSVCAISVYARGGEVCGDDERGWVASEEELEGARAFCERVCEAAGRDLPAGIVVDVGVLSTGAWAVVEANPAWGAGLYGCDGAGVLEVLGRAVRC